MNKSKRITDVEYQRLVINILDRVVDFYIILYSSFMGEKISLERLKSVEMATEEYLIKEEGFSKESIKEHNMIDEILDILQFDFSFDRHLHNNFIPPEYKNERGDYVLFSKILFELKHCISVEEFVSEAPHDNQLSENGFGNNNINSPDNRFKMWKYEFPCLHLIRLADVVRAPNVSDLIPKITKILSMRNNRSTHKESPINNAEGKADELAPIISMLEFYPERKYWGVDYIFPRHVDDDSFNDIAISFCYDVSDSDRQDALDDFIYQHEKFKIYYHERRGAFSDDIETHRIKPLLCKPSRANSHIKQINSVIPTFEALAAWVEVKMNGKKKYNAIDDIIKSNHNNEEQFESKRKAILERYSEIDRLVQKQIEQQKIIRRKFREKEEAFFEMALCNNDFYLAPDGIEEETES
ncbi:hypothetical protein [Aeromonas caviae]|nr:hypothetical protein [Aeromonas caviae]